MHKDPVELNGILLENVLGKFLGAAITMSFVPQPWLASMSGATKGDIIIMYAIAHEKSWCQFEAVIVITFSP